MWAPQLHSSHGCFSKAAPRGEAAANRCQQEAPDRTCWLGQLSSRKSFSVSESFGISCTEQRPTFASPEWGGGAAAARPALLRAVSSPCPPRGQNGSSRRGQKELRSLAASQRLPMGTAAGPEHSTHLSPQRQQRHTGTARSGQQKADVQEGAPNSGRFPWGGSGLPPRSMSLDPRPHRALRFGVQCCQDRATPAAPKRAPFILRRSADIPHRRLDRRHRRDPSQQTRTARFAPPRPPAHNRRPPALTSPHLTSPHHTTPHLSSPHRRFFAFSPFFPLLPLSAEARPARRQAYAGRADSGRRRKGGGRRKRQINNRMAGPGPEPPASGRRFASGRGKAGRAACGLRAAPAAYGPGLHLRPTPRAWAQTPPDRA